MARPPGNNASQPSQPTATSSPTSAAKTSDTTLDVQNAHTYERYFI